MRFDRLDRTNAAIGSSCKFLTVFSFETVVVADLGRRITGGFAPSTHTTRIRPRREMSSAVEFSSLICRWNCCRNLL